MLCQARSHVIKVVQFKSQVIVKLSIFVSLADLSPSHSLPSVLNQHFMKHMQAEEH